MISEFIAGGAKQPQPPKTTGRAQRRFRAVPRSAASSLDTCGISEQILGECVYIPGEGFVGTWELYEQVKKAHAEFFRKRQLQAAGLIGQ